MAVEPVAALLAGLIAFFSPCILPIVPGFLAIVTGGETASRGQRFARTAAFVGGFLVAFTVIGFLIGAVGASATFQESEVWLRRVGGLLIIGFGLAMLGLLRFSWMDRDLRLVGRLADKGGNLLGAFAVGGAFGVGWTPCVGPVLASILILAGLEGGASAGAGLLALFAVGLAVPFLLVGLAADFGADQLRRFARFTPIVEGVGGVFLIALGIAVFTGAANRLLSLVI